MRAGVFYDDKSLDVVAVAPYYQAVWSGFESSDRRTKYNVSAFISGFNFKIKKYWIVRDIDISVDGDYANLFPRGRDDYFFEANL